MDRTIRVTGRGKISVKPDRIRLNITLEGMASKYDAAIEMSAKLTEQLKDLVENLGFQRSDLKTLHFNVNTEYSGYQDEDKSWKRRLEGYRFVHGMKLEFDMDNKMLGEILYELSECTANPKFSIEHTVSDSENAKNALLAKAVEDSEKKAKILADAAKVTMGDIITIDYSWGEMEIVSKPMNEMMVERCMGAPESGYNLDIEPDDIELTDTVTVVWAIK